MHAHICLHVIFTSHPIAIAGDFKEGTGALCVESGVREVTEVNTKHRLGKVDGRFPHWVAPFEGRLFACVRVRVCVCVCMSVLIVRLTAALRAGCLRVCVRACVYVCV
jgi:hypothetical protein